jgi:amino acid adenylation domain-containing protein/non-ribosomal peptide synthase protein (TIGR01720 family)
MSTTPANLIKTNWLPLHPAQQEVYYDQITNPASPHYNTGGYIIVRGDLNKGLVQRIVGQIPLLFDALRLTFDFNGEEPLCRFAADFAPIPMPVINFSQFAEPDGEALNWMQQRFNTAFNLSDERLIEVALLVINEQEHWLFCRTHHLICDASGFAIMTNAIARQYTTQTHQVELINLHQHPDYETEVRASEEYLKSATYQKDRNYWLAQFDNTPPPLLPKRHLANGLPLTGSQSLIIELPDSLRQTFDHVAKTHNTSLQQLTIAALMVYFGRVAQQNELVLGIPVYNRRKHQWNVMGMFAGLIPFRGQYRPDQLVSDLLRQVRHQQLSDYRHQNYPVSHLNRDLHLLREGRTQLFDLVVNYLLVDFNLQFGGLPARTHDILSHEVENPLQFWWRDYGPHQPLELRVDFQKTYFTEDEARRLADRILFLIEQFDDQESVPVSSLSLLPPDEQARLRSFNPAPVSRPANQTLLTELERQARLHPEKIAIEVSGQQLSYWALHSHADQLTIHLQQAGAKPGVTVAINTERSVHLFVSLLAVLKTGATYVAIPPDYPADRQRYMLTDSGASILISETQPGDLPDTVRLITPVVGMNLLGSKPALPTQKSTDAAYLIYTSGSTGQPKGVIISQASLLDYCLTVKDYFGLTSADRVIQQASMAFDTMVEEIYPAWLAGACVVIMQQGGRDIDTIADYIENRGITMLSTTPSVIQWLNRKLTTVGQLRYLISGGEVLHPAQVDRLVDKVNVVNTYGPSESTVCVTYHPVGAANQASLLGRPITNRTVVILDEAGELTPLGEVGELCIGGAGLMRGYHNRPDLTAERLCPNPFDAETQLYRSGDLARWLPNGTLEYMGRRDEQVKIRGYRIELGEVEAALQAAPGVGQGAVAVRPGPNDTPRLIGYYVPDCGAVETADILAYLRRQLPDYMVPAQIVCLPELPMLPNGKLNKAALPDPTADQSNLTTLDEPTNEVEACLVDIWQSLFDQPVGIHDNFFELGGDSILTLQVVGRMRKSGYTLQPRHLFECPTIAQLALCVTGAVVTSAETGLLTGAAPLLPIQQQFLDEQPANPSHYNQALLTGIHKSVSADDLREAFVIMLEQHDALRFRYTPDEMGGWNQQYGLAAPNLLSKVDLRQTADWQTALADENRRVQASLSLETGELIRCLLVQTPDSEACNRLLIAIHHLAVDGVSWRILIDDLLTILEAKTQGKAAQLPPKTASYRQWATELIRYAQDEKTLHSLAYWEAVQTNQTPLPTDVDAPPAQLRAVETTQHRLAEQTTTALLTTANRPYQTQVNDLLLTALAQTITDWSGNPDVMIGLEGHGRDGLTTDLDISNTVGWFTVQYPVRLVMPSGTADQERIQAVKEQLRTVPDKGLSYGALRYMHPDQTIRQRLVSEKPFSVSFNYLGQLDALLPDNDWLTWAGQSVDNTIDPENPFSPAFDINCYVAGGQLVIDWSAARSHYYPETIARLSAAFLDNLTRLVEHCQQTERTCPTPADFQLTGLATQAELDAFLALHPEPALIESIYKLSPLQQGMLFHSLYDDHSLAYTDQLRCLIDAPVDADSLRRSWEQLMLNHSILRSAFPHESFQTPLQVVYKQVPLPFRVIDLSNLTASQQMVQADQIAQDDFQSGFDFQRPPLLRLTLLKRAPAEYEMIWTNHHLLTDGWSLPVLISELMQHYETFRQNQQPPAQPVDRYEEFIRLLENRPQDREEAFWEKYTANIESPTLLPFVSNRADRNKGVGDVQSVDWRADADLSQQIQVFLLTQRLTINTLCQGVWACLLAHYTQQTDVTFGITVSGRPTELTDADSRVGLFINTLPFRAVLSQSDTVVDWLQAQQQQQGRMQEFQHKPLREIQQLTSVDGDWFDSLLVVENYPMNNLIGQPSALPIRSAQIREQTNFLLTLVVCPDPSLFVRFVYQPTLLSEAIINQMATHFEHVLRQIVSQPQQTIGALSVITPAEEHYLRQIGEHTVAYAEANQTVVQLMERQVRRRPGYTALVFGDETITYGELNRRVNQLAHLLRDRGVCRGQVVGLCLERSPQLLIGLLAVLKAGGAYVPIDPKLPAARMHYLMADSGAGLLLCQQNAIASLVPVADGRLCLPIDKPDSWLLNQSDQNPWAISESADLAYCLYTSGSTGRPKGVRITHLSLTNYLLTCLNHYTDREQPDQTASFIHLNTAFDASVTALLTPLITGKTAVIGQGDALSVFDDPNLWAYAPYDFIKLTPAQLPLLAMAIDEHAPNRLLTTRLVVGGEALLPAHYQFWLNHPEHPVTIINEYGPTEATVGCCWYAFEPNGHEVITAGGVLIGSPMPNVQLYVLDVRGGLVGPGVVGELYIGGVQLAQGYQHRDELTAERFLNHAFGRLYRTGDLATWHENGQLAYVGRRDDQIKVRGHRIEIGEIETTLQAAPGVLGIAITPHYEQKVITGLAAYFLLTDGTDLETVRHYARQHLPEYMMPKWMRVVDELPLTTNGKVNKKALPPIVAEELASVPLEASTPLETALVTIWQQVLGRAPILTTDNFFTLGGDSIQTIQIVSRARKEGLFFYPKDIFANPTIAQLAQVIRVAETGVAEQGLLGGEAGLLPIQRAFLSNTGLVHSYFNQAVLLNIPKHMTPEALTEVLTKLVQHHDALRFRYVKTGETWQQQYTHASVTLYTENLSTYNRYALPDIITARCQHYQEQLDLETGNLMRCVWMQTADQHNRLFWTIHHVAVDAVSWLILLNDLETCLRQFAEGNLLDLGPKTMSYRQWQSALSAYAQAGSTLDQLSYWQAVVENAGPLPTDYPVEPTLVAQVETHTFSLDETTTQALLRDVHQVYQTDVNDFLLTSLGQTISDWAASERVVIGLEGHGREAINDEADVSRTVGWFTNLYPVALTFDPAQSMVNQLRAVKETLRAVPDKGMGYGALRYLNSDAFVRESLNTDAVFSLTFNYLGQFDGVGKTDGQLRLAPESVGATVSPQSRFDNQLELDCFVQDGQLRGQWRYAGNQYNRETILALADAFCTRLTAFVQHCLGKSAWHYSPADYGLTGLLDLPSFDAFVNATPGLDNVTAMYPLSPLQEAVLTFCLYEEHSSAYTEQFSCLLTGTLHADRFARAWEQVMARHSILRTSFHADDLPMPLQCVHPFVSLPFRTIDATGLLQHQQEELIKQYADEDYRTGFRLDAAPLMRVTLIQLADDQYRCFWTVHHLIIDGWSVPIVLQEVVAAYEALGRNPDSPQLTFVDEYGDFIRFLRARSKVESDRFWRGYMAPVHQPTRLTSASYTADATLSPTIEHHTLTLSPVHTEALVQYTRQHQFTINTLLQGVWAYTLAACTQAETVNFGVTVSGRPADYQRIEQRVGMFINTLPLTATVEAHQSIHQWLQSIQTGHVLAREHQYTSLSRIQWLMGMREPLFDSILVMENYPSHGIQLAAEGLTITDGSLREQTNFALTIVGELTNAIHLDFCHDTRRVTDAQVVALMQQVESLLVALPQLPSQAVLANWTIQNVTPIADVDNQGFVSVARSALQPTEVSLGIEDQLRPIWQRLLPGVILTPDTDFFQAGGDSVGLIQLANQARKQNLMLKPHDLLTCPTLRQLACFLAQKIASAPNVVTENQSGNPHLVCFQKQGDEAPICIVPGGYGQADFYTDLALALGNQQPVYGINTMGTLPGETPLESVEAIARQNLLWLRAERPHGPYRLIGHSFGTRVAYEMACQLQSAGEEVEWLGIIDSTAAYEPLPHDAKMDTVITAIEKHAALAKVDLPLQWQQTLRAQLTLDTFAQSWTQIERILSTHHTDQSQIMPLLQMLKVLLASLNVRYTPTQELPCPVILLKAEQTDWTGHQPDLGWQDCTGDLSTIEVPGDHLTMLIGDKAIGLARVLKTQTQACYA